MQNKLYHLKLLLVVKADTDTYFIVKGRTTIQVLQLQVCSLQTKNELQRIVLSHHCNDCGDVPYPT